MKSPASLFILLFAISLAITLSLRADENSTKSPIVPEGSATAGQTAFLEKGCYHCHSAGDLRFPEVVLPESLIIELGTREQAGWSRDDFAKAILNPNHAVNPEYEKAMMALGDNFKAVNSPMPSFNDMLTVSDLINLTTFLAGLNK